MLNLQKAPHNSALWVSYGFFVSILETNWLCYLKVWLKTRNSESHLQKQHNMGPLYQHVLMLIPVWISNYIHYKVWDEITYPFQNFNGCIVEVWEWISNSIPLYIEHVITYPCWD